MVQEQFPILRVNESFVCRYIHVRGPNNVFLLLERLKGVDKILGRVTWAQLF